MTEDEGARFLAVLQRLADKAREAKDNPPPRPADADEAWRFAAPRLIEIGDQVDDLELLEEREAWPDVPDRD